MELKPLSKKGQTVGNMGPTIIALVIAGVFLILGLVMLQAIRNADIIDNQGSTVCNGTATEACVAFDNVNDTLAGLATFSDFWEIIVLAIVISIVIGLLLIVFGRRTSR